MRVLKAIFVVIGAYGASLAAYFAFLVLGVIVAGKSLGSKAEASMMLTLALTAFGFVVGGILAYWGLGRVGVSGGARVATCLGYALLALLTMFALFFVTAVVFNR